MSDPTKTYDLSIYQIIMLVICGAIVGLLSIFAAGIVNRPVDATGVAVAFSVCKNEGGIKQIGNRATKYTFTCVTGATITMKRQDLDGAAAHYKRQRQ